VETLAVATTEIFSVANEVVVKEEVIKEAARAMEMLRQEIYIREILKR
jgi:hypothetical protein